MGIPKDTGETHGSRNMHIFPDSTSSHRHKFTGTHPETADHQYHPLPVVISCFIFYLLIYLSFCFWLTPGSACGLC